MIRFKAFLVIFFACYSISSQGQNYKDNLKKGNKYFKAGDYERAIVNFKKAIDHKVGNAHATYKLGIAYLHSHDKAKALPYLETVRKLDPHIERDIDYNLGLAFQYNYRYVEAKEAYERFQNRNKKDAWRANKKIEECLAGDSLYNHPTGAIITNLTATVNSKWHDYSPLITSDGQRVFFTSNRAGSTGGIRLKNGSYYEDVYTSHKKDNLWTTPEKVGGKINTKYHDAAVSIAPDGNTLFIYSDQGHGDILVSKFKDGSWTSPVSLGDKINSPYWETSISITSDGKTLYFTSDRPGGYGDLDIYKSELQENGKWGIARNLGPTINTDGNEDSPVIHPDGKSLYFSSSGHPGMGGFDIYHSELIDGKFQKPINMGHPINTVFDDNYFVISNDRKHAYYASIKGDGIGGADLYFIDMTPPPPPPRDRQFIADNTPTTSVEEPKKVDRPKTEPAEKKPAEPKTEVVKTQPAPKKEVTKKKDIYYDQAIELHKEMNVVTVIKGKVLDSKDVHPLYAEIKLIDNKTNKLVASVYSDPKTGNFELVIPHGGNYGVSTSTPGYLFNSINFNVPAFSDLQEIDTHILLNKVQVGSKVVLKNIFFDIGKSALRTESIGELEVIKKLLDENTDLKVQINGHTDNVGNAVYNKLLSKKRAQSVVNYLVAHGVKGSRLSAKGFGEERPLVSNDDEEDGREINRRTEIEVVSIGSDT